MTERRILHILPAGPFGGAQRLVIDLALAQAAKGDCPTLLFVDHDRRAPDEARQRGLAVLEPVKAGLSLDQRVLAVRKLLASKRPNIWHIHLPRPWLALALPRNMIGKRVLHLHCSPPLAEHPVGLRRWLDNYALGRMAEHAHAVIAISRWIADNYLSAFPVITNEIAVVPNGTTFFPTQVKRDKAQGALFGVASRIAPGKGIEEFLELAAAIRNRLPQARFRIAGEGDAAYLSELQGMARALGVYDAIEFVGFVSDIEEFWAEIDMGLFTAPLEPFGLRLIEPLAFGVPVAAYLNASGSDEVVRLCRGVIAMPYRHAHELANQIAAQFSKAGRLSELKALAQRDVETHFTLERMRANIDRVYAQVELT